MQKRKNYGVTFEALAKSLGLVPGLEIAAVDVQHIRQMVWLTVTSQEFKEVPEGQEAPWIDPAQDIS